MIAFYDQTKTPISFWCRRGLNPKSLIQPSEILPVELTGTHYLDFFIPNKYIVQTHFNSYQATWRITLFLFR